jgi:hypothetical protein
LGQIIRPRRNRRFHAGDDDRSYTNNINALVPQFGGCHSRHGRSGEIGHGEIRVFTTLGDVVNVTARLEGLCKDFSREAVISHDVCAVAGVPAETLPEREAWCEDPRRGHSSFRDKVLLVLSAASIASDWVEDEVTKAFAEERQRGGMVLFPARLDDAVFVTREAWALKLRDNRHIGDFHAWTDHDAYQCTLERLLRDLRVETPDAAPG